LLWRHEQNPALELDSGDTGRQDRQLAVVVDPAEAEGGHDRSNADDSEHSDPRPCH